MGTRVSGNRDAAESGCNILFSHPNRSAMRDYLIRRFYRLGVLDPCFFYPRFIQMDHVNLGSSGLKVSRLCLGTMTYGSSKWREWVLDEEQSRPLIRQA